MNLVSYAEEELDRIGMTDDGEMNGAMRKHLVHMIKEFAGEGHSGFSANYAIGCLKRLMSYKPLSPLTGEDDEWADVTTMNDGEVLFQNRRYSAVFKDSNGAYDIDAKVFWHWTTIDGEHHKYYYTTFESRVPVTFPYTVPDEPIYEYKQSDNS